MLEASAEEREVEAKLRPGSLGEFVGQNKVVDQLSLVLSAARLHNRAPDHILLAGPPGLGKTTLAMIVAHDSNKSLRLTSGPAIQSSGDLASILSALEPGDVLFVDEIHRMSRSADEMLYLAMEDFRHHSRLLVPPRALVCSQIRFETDSGSPRISSFTTRKSSSAYSRARPHSSTSRWISQQFR